MKKHLEVVGAILVYDGKILCMQRGKGKFSYTDFKYEFPGGKIEPGETKHAALERELREEMDLDIAVDENDLYITVNHEYPDFTITMYTFLCRLDKPDFTRKEHASHCWLAPDKLYTLEWAGADAPIIDKLAQDTTL